VERYEYDVYGEPEFYDGSYNAITESAIGNPYLFTSRRYDPESGNYYYRARIYSPALGRFLSLDPLGYEAGDANLYRYVFNNPVNFTDPTGETPLLVTALIGGLLNLTADYLITTYLEDEVYSWPRAGTAFGTGALAGLTGVGIGALAGRATSGIIAWGIRIGLNAGSNATINYIQRYLNKECTLAEDVLTDLLFGSVAGGLDGVFERIIISARPHINPVKIIKNTRFGIINSGKWAGRQGLRLFREEIPVAIRYWEGAMSGLALGLSNSSIVSVLTTAVSKAADKLQEWINEEDFE
jgi:RHS repeat-associated protein